MNILCLAALRMLYCNKTQFPGGELLYSLVVR